MKKGFTLIEILFVIVVLAIIAAIVIPRLTTTQDTAKQNACDANIANINTQIERYYFDVGAWPTDANFTQMKPPLNYTYFPSDVPVCPVSRVVYHMNTTIHRIIDIHDATGAHDHQTQ